MMRSAVACALLALALHASASVAPEVTLDYEVQKVVQTGSTDPAAATLLVPADAVAPGDELVYTIAFTNEGASAVAARGVVITNPIPPELVFVAGSAAGDDTEISYSVDDGRTFAPPEGLTVAADGIERTAPASSYTTIRWVFTVPLEPGATSRVWFRARLE
jgi:uncharacterized repeat protein (TIGR01451 family)